jgi:hypothetical protein
VTGSEMGDMESSDTISLSAHSLPHQYSYDEDPTSYGVGNRKANAKKQTLIINKLKSELASARNTIAMARMNDIVILKTKLRAAETDFNRVRFQNVELKENIEKLELRLFELLSSNAQRAQQKQGQRPGNDALEKVPSTRADSSVNIANEKGQKQSASAAQQDLQPPPQSKEELWIQRRKATKLDELLLPLPQELSHDIEGHLKDSIERAAEADRKTISELVKELHRMEELQQKYDSVNKCDRATSTTAIDDRKGKGEGEEEDANGVSSLNNSEFSQRDLLYSFFAGAIVMICSVIISSLGSPSPA